MQLVVRVSFQPAHAILTYELSVLSCSVEEKSQDAFLMRKTSLETPCIIQSLDRGLLILEAVAKSREPVVLDQLAELLNIDRSSAFRLANTLKRRGFLTYPSRRKEYILGPSIWRLARPYDWGSTLANVSREHLKKLASAVGETAHLAVREGKRALFIDHATVNQTISVSGQTGELVPLYCTAHGKALLADMSQEDLASLFNNDSLHRYTPGTVTSVDDLAAVCTRIKAQGFATDNAEFLEGIRCVAAPIRDEEGVIVGSIGISAPLTRFPEKRYSVVGKQVREIARQISETLSAHSD
jgi:IclR family transcriptional regulator, acetate operon repressor